MVAGEALGFADPFSGSDGWLKRYGDQEISQFRGADLIAEKWELTREEMEAFSVESHARALRARSEGRFEREIVGLRGCVADEGPREPDWGRSGRCLCFATAVGSPPPWPRRSPTPGRRCSS